MAYNPSRIEKKWQDYWLEHDTFRAEIDQSKEKAYILDMFPYPSGQGLHVGHPEGYTATDIVARYKRMRGINVLHCIGWDAFGLPAEQHAIKTGQHPAITTEKNIDTFRKQLRALGFSYDWNREVDTTDPGYYRWTQWIFLQIFNQGLAYQEDAPVNWCPELRAVLANEEVIDGLSERGGHPVYKKNLRQWLLQITAYADRLLNDLEGLDWPDRIKEMQRNWIGKSHGALASFGIQGSDQTFEVYTTRPDTMFGATYCVLAPEHPLIARITSPAQQAAVSEYQHACSMKSDRERMSEEKQRTGIFTGAYAINPINAETIPIWISDYVLYSYGTGAIMAVPAHDQRDFEFAQEFNLPIITVVEDQNAEHTNGECAAAFSGQGTCINSGFLDGLSTSEAIGKAIDYLNEHGLGKPRTNYKLRDWLFSRQRYWGEPIPIALDADKAAYPIPDCELPVLLPELEDYVPSENGASPLGAATEWLNYTTAEGKALQRETNTMPQWAGSCWYYLRFTDPHNAKQAWSPEAEKYWMPVDLYVGGAEHAVLHLLYARFWHKVLYDLGHVSTPEPFMKLVNQGLILGENGEKMSKSAGNIVNPDDVVGKYGADTLRLYEMFMGPLEKSKPWQGSGLEGIFRFLNKAWNLLFDANNELRGDLNDEAPSAEELHLLHCTIQKVSKDIEKMKFNTAISQMMIFVNSYASAGYCNRESLQTFVLLLSPFAPHLCEEAWQKLGHDKTLAYEQWPEYNLEYTARETCTLVVQVNGKLRAKLQVACDLSQEECLTLAQDSSELDKFIAEKSIIKVIHVPNRLLNLVVR